MKNRIMEERRSGNQEAKVLEGSSTLILKPQDLGLEEVTMSKSSKNDKSDWEL